VDAVLPPEDEFAALRRRAYGPDADIGSDPRAQARLAELEREPPGAISRVRSRLPWLLAAIAAIAAVVAVGAYLFDAVTRPPLEARLVALEQPLSGDVPPALGEKELGLLETRNPAFVSHGGYGALKVWSTTAPRDRRCLAVVFEGTLWRFDCTAATIDTVADVVIHSHLLPPDAAGRPVRERSTVRERATVRFVLHDDVVDVYVGWNEAPNA